MQRQIRVWEIASGSHMELYIDQIANVALRYQPDNRLVDFKCVRRRNNLRNQMRSAFGSIQHFECFIGVHRHTCFAQHMLLCFERLNYEGRMHVWPSSYTYGIDFVVFKEFYPIFVDFRYFELASHSFRRLS